MSKLAGKNQKWGQSIMGVVMKRELPRKSFPTEAQIRERKRFKEWCQKMGYFPHTKYLEAWMAALSYTGEVHVEGG